MLKPPAQTDAEEGPRVAPYPGPYDVPVIIDDVKHLDDFHMTRCTIFTIAAVEAIDDWVADLRSRDVPFLLLGITAVVHRPPGGGARFEDLTQIDELIDAIERLDGVVVETDHIWLPNFLFEMGRDEIKKSAYGDQPPARGSVYRVSFELFRLALRFRREMIGTDGFTRDCHALHDASPPPVESSPAETAVLRDWSAAQLVTARTRYEEQRDDPERGVLAWRDEYGKVSPG